MKHTELKRRTPLTRKIPLTSSTLGKKEAKPILGKPLKRSGFKGKKTRPGDPDDPETVARAWRGTPPRRSQPKRDWKDARAKVEVEAVCRVGGDCEGPLEAAHIIGREHDLFSNEKNVAWVNPHRIVPLCKKHHMAYDAHELDILAALTTREQVQAVEDAGSIETARVRTCPSLYRRA